MHIELTKLLGKIKEKMSNDEPLNTALGTYTILHVGAKGRTTSIYKLNMNISVKVRGKYKYVGENFIKIE